MNPIGQPFLQTIQGTPLHWLDAGQGRPLVLLHGLADSHRTWTRVAPLLVANRRLLMLDLAGHGLSGRPQASYELSWHASLVHAWLDALGVDDFDLVGHSFGGGVAQTLLLTRGRSVRRLGLVASGGLGREVALGVRLLSLPGAGRVVAPFLGVGTRVALRVSQPRAFDREDRAWLSWVNGRPGTAQALVRTVRGVIDLRGQNKHFLDRAGEVGPLPPIHLYWGTRDPVIPPSQARDALRFVRPSSVTWFRDCGHLPHREFPVSFARELDAFLRDPHVSGARVFVAVPRAPRAAWWRRLLRAVGGLFRGKQQPESPPKAPAAAEGGVADTDDTTAPALMQGAA